MTNKELAGQLNISPTALSFILNHKPGVSAATRNRVLKQLEELGLSHLVSSIPSAAKTPASSLKILAFVVYKRHGQILDRHPYFLLLMESLEQQAQNFGYNLIIKTLDKSKDMDIQLQALCQCKAMGYLFFGTEMLDDDISCLNQLDRPFLIMDNNFSFHALNTVSIDNQLGTYQAIEYLYNMGHRKIGYLWSETRISSFEERRQGYISAMKHFGIELPMKYSHMLPYTEELSYQSFKEILNQKPELPTAFVSDDDTIASGVMKALTERNIHVPEDISIIGFNDRPLCKETTPKMTSVNVPRNSFGAEAVDALIRIIENTNPTHRPLKIRIGTQLAIRDSVTRR